MSSDVVTILAAVITGIAAILATLLGVYLTQGRKSKISYTVSSIPILRLKPKPHLTLEVLADKSLLTGKDGDRGIVEAISEAYAFEINLQNGGKEDITDKTDIAIQLSEAAKIVGCQIDSRNPYQPEAKSGREPNTIIITLPYLKSKSQTLIRLISTENRDRTCEVQAIGSKIRMQPRKYPIVYPIIGAILTIIGGLLLDVFIAFEIKDFYSTIVGATFLLITVMGGVLLYLYNPHLPFSSVEEVKPPIEWDVLDQEKKRA